MNLLLKDEDDFEEYRRQGGAAKMIRSMITDASGDN